VSPNLKAFGYYWRFNWLHGRRIPLPPGDVSAADSIRRPRSWGEMASWRLSRWKSVESMRNPPTCRARLSGGVAWQPV